MIGRRFPRDVALLLRYLDETAVLSERESSEGCCMGGMSERYCGFFGCTPDGCSGHEVECSNPSCDIAPIMRLVGRIERQLAMSKPTRWRPWRMRPRWLSESELAGRWRFNPEFDAEVDRRRRESERRALLRGFR